MKPFPALDLGGQHIFFVRSLLDLVWNGFVYARFWRFNCLAWHYNTACRSASVALFCSESAGNTARAAEKQTVGEQQNINSTWPGSPGEMISFRLVNCEFTERPPYFAGTLSRFRWMGYTPSTNRPQKRRNPSSKRNLSLWVSYSSWEGLVEQRPAQIRLQSSGCAPEPSLAECKPPSY